MDWHSRWGDDPPTETQKNALHAFEDNTAFYINDINAMDSSSVSKDDSFESFTEDHIEKSDTSVIKPTFKSILQAKKRLQAFSAAKQLRRNPSKDEKTEEADKMSPKKSKKVLYPMDKAQAVIQEIEEIKQKEAKEAREEKQKMDAIMSVASFKNFSIQARPRSPSAEGENQFRKREIKCRNYRRSDSFKRRSLSPENHNKRSGRLVYPPNWTEYKNQGLTIVKDEELKSKIFPKVKHNTHDLVAKFLSFEGPSPLTESYKILTLEDKVESVPFSFLRITRSKPTLTYSVNYAKIKNSFVTRKQLFHVIPRERRAIIEKFINSASSKSQFQSRTLTSRLWYSKSWKRSPDTECKILENSVGLSFLQTYSDEEEDNESEEIATVNKEAEISVKHSTLNEEIDEIESYVTNHNDSFQMDEEFEDERGTLTPEETPDMTILRRQREDEIEESKKTNKRYRQEEEQFEKEQTPEIIPKPQKEEGKKKDKDELNETRKAIKELEEELERRKALREEEEEQEEARKMKKKKSKKKEASSDSSEEETPKKRKRKKRAKKKKYTEEEEEDSDSSDSDAPKKSKKKSKRKNEKGKKKSKKTGSSPKEHTAKKMEEDSEEDGRKKKKVEDSDEFAPEVEVDTKKRKKRDKSKKNSNDEEEIEAKKKNPTKEKEKAKNRCDSSDFMQDKEIELFGGFGKLNNLIPINDLVVEPIEYAPDPPQKTTKDKRNDDPRDVKQKDSRKSRETSVKSDDGGKRRKEFDLSYDYVKTNEKSKDKHREEKYKTEIEHERLFSRNPEKRSRSSEEFSKEDVPMKREDSKVKTERLKDHKHKAEPVFVKKEPDWEKLRSKRNKHRNNDYKDYHKDFCDDFTGFPLEKDLYTTNEKHKGETKRQVGTPDTEEYRENWEKESDPIWESEDEVPNKVKGKLNSSWESDEEVFERGHQAVETSRPISNVFDLEIPLNIKPFKRREVIDPDKELVLLKKQSLSLDEERRQLEIEKQRVKELELEVIKEVEYKAKEDNRLKRRWSKERDGTVENVGKKKEFSKRASVEKDETTLKRGRWDKKMSSPKISHPKQNIIEINQIKKEIIDEDSLTNVSSTTSVNTTAVLENEYEEFMKALTSSPKKPPEKKRIMEEEIHSDNSSPISRLDIKASNPVKVFDTPLINLETQIPLPPLPVPQIVTILPKDIPLIPMPLPKMEIEPVPEVKPVLEVKPAPEIKPVPVPSPQIEMDSIPKPLINLSLSANITLDIAPKFTTPPFESPGTSVGALQSVVSHPTDVEMAIDGESTKLSSAMTESSLESMDISEETVPNKPFVFTTMVLASKRPLLNSTLNLGDSDDEDKPTKPLKKLEDFVEEINTEEARIPVESPKVEVEVKKTEPETQPQPVKNKETDKEEKKAVPVTLKSGTERESRRKRSPERPPRKTASLKRSSYGGKRDSSPRRRGRESPSRRRGHSPKRHSPRRRLSPPKRRSPGKRRHSPRRSPSPKTRRRSSISPRRRSPPRRSPSPKFRGSSPKKVKSKTPDRHTTSRKSSERSSSTSNKPKSPTAINSPLEGLKRSVADSTISDDLLPQPGLSVEEYMQSPVTQFYDRTAKAADSPKREPLDVRINQVLGLTNPPREMKEQPRPIPTTYSNYSYDATFFSQQFEKTREPKSSIVTVQQTYTPMPVQQSKSTFVQVGNMVQILPTEDIPPPVHMEMPRQRQRHPGVVASVSSPLPRPQVKHEMSKIVQVGNMLQIVPTDLPPEPSLPPLELKVEPPEPPVPFVPVACVPVAVQEKQSAETAMRLKVAERREEREKRRQERERRRKEKEKRRREKERQRQIKLKQRTENMIKRALELEAEGLEEESPEAVLNDAPIQWPPLSLSVASAVVKEAGKGILRAGSKNESPRLERRKAVQFADGVRPGEGTSPSGGEELSSPPPRKKLPKEKRYKKIKLHNKNQKKKVKVKIIKKLVQSDDSDDDHQDLGELDLDTLPPPSPPPGSPPPHIFPPRVKSQQAAPINTLQPYLQGIVTSTQQQQFRASQIGIVMHPHHHHPPHHHHGPPPPPPHHHHGPPPPHHHHPHHPPPPGPPHFHHGPPPPPPHHHGPPPPPGPPHHHHHGPPPPFHH